MRLFVVRSTLNTPWAFDLLIDRPVEKECGVIATWLVGRGILPGAEILDAGAGRDDTRANSHAAATLSMAWTSRQSS